MAQGSPHDAYRHNNHRGAAATTMMSPTIIPAGLDAYHAALMQASPYDQMSFAMSQLALGPLHAEPSLAAQHAFPPAFAHAAPPFSVPPHGHRRASSAHGHAPSHDKRFAPPPPPPPPPHFLSRQPPSAPHHAAPLVYGSPFAKPMHPPPNHGAWSAPGAAPRPRMNARVPSTLNSHKVRPQQHTLPGPHSPAQSFRGVGGGFVRVREVC